MSISGDIWNTGAFAFDSPLKDLLDSLDFTLEDLLSEDELLQELRGEHPQLVQFFSSEDNVAELIKCLIRTPSFPESESGVGSQHLQCARIAVGSRRDASR